MNYIVFIINSIVALMYLGLAVFGKENKETNTICAFLWAITSTISFYN